MVITIANETTILVNLIDTGANVPHSHAVFSADRSGDNKIEMVQAVGTSNEALITNSDIGTVGWAYFENLDATNFISVGTTDDTVYFLKLLAGEKTTCPIATMTLWAKADTAGCSLRYTFLER